MMTVVTSFLTLPNHTNKVNLGGVSARSSKLTEIGNLDIIPKGVSGQILLRESICH